MLFKMNPLSSAFEEVDLKIRKKRNITVLGYFNNNKLMGYIFFLGEYDYKIEILYVHYNNKYSALKMLILFYSFYKHSFIYVSKKYISNLKENNFYSITEYKNYFWIQWNKKNDKIENLNNNILLKTSTLSTINKSLNMKDICDVLIKKNDPIYVYNNIQPIKRIFIKTKMNSLSQIINEDKKIYYYIESKKNLFNHGEKNYIKILKKDGFIKSKNNPTIKNPKIYNIEFFDNHVVVTKKILKSLDTTNFKVITLKTYETIFKYIKENNKGKQYYFLNKYFEKIDKIYLKQEYPIYMLENRIKSIIFYENILKENSIPKKDLYKSIVIWMNNNLGKDYTNFFFKTIDKNKLTNFKELYFNVLSKNFLSNKALKLFLNNFLNSNFIIDDCIAENIKNLSNFISYSKRSGFNHFKESRKIISNDIKKGIIEKKYYSIYFKNKVIKSFLTKKDIEKHNNNINQIFNYCSEELNDYELFFDYLNVFNSIEKKKENIFIFSTFFKDINKIKEIIGEKNSLRFLKNYYTIYKQNNDNFHDTYILYFHYLFSSKLIDEDCYKKIIDYKLYKVKKIVNIIRRILNTYKSLYLKIDKNSKFLNNLREEIKKCILKNKPMDFILEDMENKILENYCKDISEKSKKQLSSFVNNLNLYGEVSLVQFISIFENKIFDIINYKIDCTFNEYSLDNRTKKLGNFISKVLGNKTTKGLIRNNKKLYGKLRTIYNVDDILKGNYPIQLFDKFIEILKEFNISIPEDVFYWGKIEKKCSPEYLMAGDITNCCMSFGSEKAKIYALEKGFSILNIFNNDKIVSNSLIWINKKNNYLVLDNIECKSNFIKKSKYIKEVYFSLIKYILKTYDLNGVVQGAYYNDIKLYSNKEKSYKFSLNAKDIKKLFYSDAKYVYYINI